MGMTIHVVYFRALMKDNLAFGHCLIGAASFLGLRRATASNSFVPRNEVKKLDDMP